MQQIQRRWGGRRCDMALLREIVHNLEIPATIDREWITVEFDRQHQILNVRVDIPSSLLSQVLSMPLGTVDVETDG